MNVMEEIFKNYRDLITIFNSNVTCQQFQDFVFCCHLLWETFNNSNR